jgi:hypothetical protein
MTKPIEAGLFVNARIHVSPPQQRERVVRPNVPGSNLVRAGRVIETMKRVWMILAGALASSLAMGQASHLEARQWFVKGIQPMASSASITITLEGFDQRGEVKTPLQVAATAKRSQLETIPTSWLEVAVARNGSFTHRIVGDGERVWSYSTQTGEYSSSQYQNLETPREGHLSRMLLVGARWSPREADFAIRLVRDIFSGEDLTNRWTPWLSGAAPVTVTVDKFVCDIAYATPTALLTYRLERDTEESPWQLTSAFFRQERMISGELQATVWEARILPDTIDPEANFKFYPPAGSRVRAIGG